MQLGAVSLTLLLLILLPGAVVPTRLCGKKLVDVLKNLCKHQYNTRSTAFDSPEKRLFAGGDGKGIVDQCCFQSCSFSTLMSYCGDATTSVLKPVKKAEVPVATEFQPESNVKATANRVPTKTFRSLFHLLNYVTKMINEDLNKP